MRKGIFVLSTDKGSPRISVTGFPTDADMMKRTAKLQSRLSNGWREDRH